MTAPILDGVHFGLPEAEYHADSALGSTDLKALATSPCDWWHASKLNPDREPDADTPSRLYGRALHKCVLEGFDAFHHSYAPKAHGSEFLHTADDISAWIKERTPEGEKPKLGTSKADRMVNLRALAERLAVIPPSLAEECDAAHIARGRTLLANDDMQHIVSAGDAILANPHLASSFVGGVPEVSVFWTDPQTGVRLKCRQDYVKSRATVDLKSIRPQRPGPFPQSCLRAIAEWRYHGQAAHYTDGREMMHGFIRDGLVFGSHDPAWLRTLSQDFAFVFVFIQADGAPLTWGTILSPDNAAIHNGRERIRRGISAYLDYSERFPDGAPWLDHEPLTELNIDDLPNWALI